MEILTILAILLGPICAVQASQWLERKRLKKYGKLYVFKTLMKTRAARLDPSHIEALNMIDVEFYGKNKKDKAVVEAWKCYQNNLSFRSGATSQEVWNQKNQECILDLLSSMATALSYDFNCSEISDTSYFPDALVDAQNDQIILRKALLAVLGAILDGKIDVPIKATNTKNW